MKLLALLALAATSALALPGYIQFQNGNGYLGRGVRTSKYGVDYYGNGSPVLVCVPRRAGGD